MKVRLEKQNRKTVDFVEMEIKDHLLEVTTGKVGISKSRYTTHCGTTGKANFKVEELIRKYEAQHYKKVNLDEKDSFDGVYDKAKWHFDGNFPKELDNFHGYIHTGMFLTWLIDNDLLDTDFANEFKEGIDKTKKREMSGAQFYADYLDGVLADEELNDIANKFSHYYYHSENAEFLNDYEKILAKDLPTLYHVKDEWANYYRLKPVIDKRFREWKKLNSHRT